jgi:hypothetical protein
MGHPGERGIAPTARSWENFEDEQSECHAKIVEMAMADIPLMMPAEKCTNIREAHVAC